MRVTHSALLALLGLLVGCQRHLPAPEIRPITAAVAPRHAPSPPSGTTLDAALALEQPTTASTDAAAPQPRGPDDTLIAAIERVFVDPRDALVRLRAIDQPLARTWEAYVLFAAQHDEAAARAAVEPFEEGTEPDPDAGTAGFFAALLYQLNERTQHAEEDDLVPPGDRTRLVMCALIERHGDAAIGAFEMQYGSMRDSFGAAVLELCSERVLARATLSDVERARARAAVGAVAGEVFRVMDVPESGTLYRAMAMQVDNAFRRAMLETPRVGLAAAQRNLASALARARGPGVGAVRARAARFAPVVERNAPAIAVAIAAAARARGANPTPEQVQEMARAVCYQALAGWLANAQEVLAELDEERRHPLGE